MNGDLYPGNGTIINVISQDGVKFMQTCDQGADNKAHINIAVASDPAPTVETPTIECTDARGIYFFLLY